MRPMNEREIFTSDATVVQVDEQDPQQMQVGHSTLGRKERKYYTFRRYSNEKPGNVPGCPKPTARYAADRLAVIHMPIVAK